MFLVAIPNSSTLQSPPLPSPPDIKRKKLAFK